MKQIRYFYKTKTLYNNGIFIISAAVVLLLAAYFIIPEIKTPVIDKQIYTLNGLALKYNDSPIVSHFIQSIKHNDGRLCLGTSESTELPGGNYYDFLNNDPDVESRFSILSGAGRTCSNYIPILLHHREEVKGLKLIYLINPCYWRTDLCKPNIKYWSRYCNYKMCSDISLSDSDRTNYFLPVEAHLDKLNFFQKTTFSFEFVLRNARKKFFQDLKHLFYPSAYEEGITYILPEKRPLSSYTLFGEVDYEAMDTLWNIKKTFKNKGWFKPIDESVDFRYQELRSFVKLCSNTGVAATFIVGPYNGRFIQNYDSKSLEAYEKTCLNIKQLLTEEGASYIDATDISFTPGAFDDHQHHSSYGAYLIYNKIKTYTLEKENN